MLIRRPQARRTSRKSRRALALAVALAAVALVCVACVPPPEPPPPPPAAPAAPSAFPDAASTGVPAGVNLTPYTGPLTIRTCGVVIDSKIIDGELDVRAGNGTRSAATPCVTIRNSLIRGIVDNGYSAQGYGPLVLQDTEIAAPTPSPSAALLLANWYGWRLDIHGGTHGAAQCDGFCELHDSRLHDYVYVSGVHYDAFVTNGNGGRPIVLDHNTLACNFVNPWAQDGRGGCSAPVGLFGDFDPVSRVTVTRNLFVANPNDFYYCAYTGTNQPGKPFPSGSDNLWQRNVFQRGGKRCGDAGPVYDWSSGNNNIWSGNTWDDGAPLDM